MKKFIDFLFEQYFEHVKGIFIAAIISTLSGFGILFVTNLISFNPDSANEIERVMANIENGTALVSGILGIIGFINMCITGFILFADAIREFFSNWF